MGKEKPFSACCDAVNITDVFHKENSLFAQALKFDMTG